MQGVSKNIVAAAVFVVLAGSSACSSSSGTGGSEDNVKGAGASDGSGGDGGSEPAATGGTSQETGGASSSTGGAASAFPDEALSTFMTPDKGLQIELRTSPAQPIHVGPKNEGQLRITDMSTGAKVDGLDVGVTTWMPLMKHKCSEAPVKVVPQGDGVYLLTPLVASMPGACELKLTVGMPAPDGGAGKPMSVVSPTFEVTQQ